MYSTAAVVYMPACVQDVFNSCVYVWLLGCSALAQQQQAAEQLPAALNCKGVYVLWCFWNSLLQV
jgi:hypothetical protein